MQISALRPIIFAFSAAIIFLAANASATEPNQPTTKTEPPAAVAPVPHCQVPCGIYTDQLRFEQMLEDTKTIAKAIASVETISKAIGDGELSPTNVNQLTRWINTKEDHASKIQKTIADYFLTQRIKESNDDYTSQLIASHKVMVAAMKCKQDAKPETAETLKKAILDLYRAYEGKEPNFEHADAKAAPKKMGANSARVKIETKTLSNACKMYKLRVGAFPAKLQDLKSLPEGLDKANWGGPYVDKLPNDPWGQPYKYTPNDGNNTVLIQSSGPDGKMDSQDDVSNM